MNFMADNSYSKEGKMFNLVSKYKPSGDQPEAIYQLVKGIKEGKKNQVLLGATGTGKTFTIANVIAEVDKPTLVLAHNKTLAGQLYSELKELFPDNRVEYFVSYYDYYQPEAYVPSTDTYIEKDSSINDEIDEKELNKIILKADKYEKVLQRIYLYFKSNDLNIEWLEATNLY